jgi:hypothetical protein
MTRIKVTDDRIQLNTDDKDKILTRSAAGVEKPISPLSRVAHLDALLDEALDESFPASDPIAVNFESPATVEPSEKEPDDR